MKCPYDIPLKPVYCRLAESWIVEDANGKVVFADLNISEAKAKYIVKAINSYEKYRIALIKIKAIEDAWDNAIPECDICYDVQRIAEQALKESEKP